MTPPAIPALLETLQRETFDYFLHETNPRTGLVVDKTAPKAAASIAATGLALAAYPVGVERGFIGRVAAARRTLLTLRFFHQSVQSEAADATGYRGFYYHFLDMESGARAGTCELSTVDSGFLFAGMLMAAEYFNGSTDDEREIRELTDTLYQRADWRWACHGGDTLTHGWSPEDGFLQWRWEGYDEALFLYLLALGSPTFPIDERGYTQWAASYEWRTDFGIEYLYAGPLFTHQISHLWVDLRAIQDAPMRERGLDYFENSGRATRVQQQYAIKNPKQFRDYSAVSWGISASDGPGPVTQLCEGIERQFFDYVARGVPDGPDDGTLAPWAVVASLPFCPDLVTPALDHFDALQLRANSPYGFKATFNATFTDPAHPTKLWVSPYHFGLNQGPIVLMIENYRSGLLWQLSRSCAPLVKGLRRAGFTGGWLAEAPG